MDVHQVTTRINVVERRELGSTKRVDFGRLVKTPGIDVADTRGISRVVTYSSGVSRVISSILFVSVITNELVIKFELVALEAAVLRRSRRWTTTRAVPGLEVVSLYRMLGQRYRVADLGFSTLGRRSRRGEIGTTSKRLAWSPVVLPPITKAQDYRRDDSNTDDTSNHPADDGTRTGGPCDGIIMDWRRSCARFRFRTRGRSSRR